MSGRWLLRIFRVASLRFAALYVGLFVGSVLVLGAAVFLESRSALQTQMEGRIEAETSFLVSEYRLEGLEGLLNAVRTRGHGASALDYLVQDEAGAHLAGEMPSVVGLGVGWRAIGVRQATEDNGGPEQVRALVTDLGGGLLLAVGGDTRQVGDLEEAIATALAWTIGLAAVLGVGGGAMLSRAFLRRVDAISRTAEAIIEGDMTRRVPLRGTGDDLDHLAATLNRMLDRISALMESLRQVSSDVAHDLRTPITRLYQRLEDARTRSGSVADYQVALDGATAEVQGLLGTFSALLRIAQVEGTAARDQFAELNLGALVDTVVDAYRPDAEGAGYRLESCVRPGVTIRGDGELLTQALANLIENALHHTQPGTRVSVILARDGARSSRLSVEDDGPGVAASDLPRLTDRFYRGERSRTTPGNGLGLSLVAAIAELHGAELDLAVLHPGFRASIVFHGMNGPGLPDERG